MQYHLTWCKKINKENDFRYIHLLNGTLEEKLETLKQMKSNDSMKNEDRKPYDLVAICWSTKCNVFSYQTKWLWPPSIYFFVVLKLCISTTKKSWFVSSNVQGWRESGVHRNLVVTQNIQWHHIQLNLSFRWWLQKIVLILNMDLRTSYHHRLGFGPKSGLKKILLTPNIQQYWIV